MRSLSHGRVCSLGLLLVYLVGCASANPTATVTETAQTLAARGVPGVEWRTAVGASDQAVALSHGLLATPLTPARAGAVALLRSHELQADLAELGVAQADLAQAARLANPGISFSFLQGSGETRRTGGVAANLVDWLTQPLRRRMAEAELERTKLEVGAAVFHRVSYAQETLVEYQAAQATVALLQQTEETDRAAADYARALHAAGNLSLRERSLIEASWVESRGELGVAESARDRARESLLRALGLGADEVWTAEALTGPPGLPGVEVLEGSRRLDLAAAKWSVEMLEKARALHRRTRWLPVGVDLGVEQERENGVHLTGPTIELALPIFDNGSASLARYDAEIYRARSQLAALEINIRSEVREAAGAFAAAKAHAALYRESLIPLRRQVLELTVKESNQMLVGAFELLAAKKDVLDAEMKTIRAVAECWKARIELDRALGRMIDSMETGP